MSYYKGCGYYYRSRANGVWGDWNSLHGFFAPASGQVPTLRSAISVIKDRFYDDIDKIHLGIGRSLSSILATHAIDKCGHSYCISSECKNELRDAFCDLHDLL